MKIPDELFFGRQLDRSYLREFTTAKNKTAIDRVRVASWLIGSVYIVLLFADYMRGRSSDATFDRAVYDYLHKVHFTGLVFLLIAIPTQFFNSWVKRKRWRQRLFLYGFLVIIVFTVFTNAVLSYHEAGSLVLYVGFVLVANWALAMNIAQMLMFNIIALTLISFVIFSPIASLQAFSPPQDPRVFNLLKFFEASFMTLTAFIFAFFDSNLRVNTFNARKALQKEKEKIEQLERTKTRLYMDIAHELCSPLTVISGSASQMVDTVDGQNHAKVVAIQRNSQRVLHLINQMLELNKLESGHKRLRLALVEIVVFLRFIQECFQPVATAKGLDLSVSFNRRELWIGIDPDASLNVLGNLVSNAIKYTPDGGKIQVVVELIEKDEGDKLNIKVMDNGIGIQPEDLPHIFDRFYRVDDDGLNGVGGTGIGLALVKEYTELANGTIEVFSEPNMGTEFSITIPVVYDETLPRSVFTKSSIARAIDVHSLQAPERTIEPVMQSLLVEEAPTVLVVEDDAHVRQFVATCLIPEYRVYEAANGQQGLDLAIAQSPDVILSDVVMPEMDGIEMCRRIKEEINTSHIPVIMLSVRSEIETRLKGLSEGAIDYLPKPFHEEELITKVKNLIEMQKALQKRYHNLDETLLNPSENKEDAFVLRVREVIMDRLDDADLTTAELCRAMGMSRTQVHNKLKALTGSSSSMFIRDVRMNEACKLLRKGDLNISEVAYDVGYSDPSYFSRVFMEVYGMTPSQYKSKYAGVNV